MINRYKKGKRVYTHWDKNFKQVTISSNKKQTKQTKKTGTNPVMIDVPEFLVGGLKANLFVVKHSLDEFIVDFCFLPIGKTRARVVSRVIMSPQVFQSFIQKITKEIPE